MDLPMETWAWHAKHACWTEGGNSEKNHAKKVLKPNENLNLRPVQQEFKKKKYLQQLIWPEPTEWRRLYQLRMIVLQTRDWHWNLLTDLLAHFNGLISAHKSFIYSLTPPPPSPHAFYCCFIVDSISSVTGSSDWSVDVDLNLSRSDPVRWIKECGSCQDSDLISHQFSDHF